MGSEVDKTPCIIGKSIQVDGNTVSNRDTALQPSAV